jgi:hypothetical protein
VLGATWHSYSGPSFSRHLARSEQWPCADTTVVLFPLRAVRCRTQIVLLQLRSETLSSASVRPAHPLARPLGPLHYGGDVPAGESEPTWLESAHHSVPAVYLKSLSTAACLGRCGRFRKGAARGSPTPERLPGQRSATHHRLLRRRRDPAPLTPMGRLVIDRCQNAAISMRVSSTTGCPANPTPRFLRFVC